MACTHRIWTFYALCSIIGLALAQTETETETQGHHSHHHHGSSHNNHHSGHHHYEQLDNEQDLGISNQGPLKHNLEDHSIEHSTEEHSPLEDNTLQEPEEVEDYNPQDELLKIDITNRATIGYVSCNFNEIPRITCYDCYTTQECKVDGGRLKLCNNQKPYCRNGVCTPFPTLECEQPVEIETSETF